MKQLNGHLWFETGAWASVLGAMMGVLPALTALIGLCYWSIMLYEKVTGKRFYQVLASWLRGK